MANDWMHKYPGVQALLQQPGDVVPEPVEWRRSPETYILDGHTPVPVEDVLTWGRWFETTDRHIDETALGEVRVSTIFLGLDHNFWGQGPPILFETLVFGGPLDGEMDRYSSWDEAEAGHAAMCARVRAIPGGTDDAPTP
jgi:hypothetical protein